MTVSFTPWSYSYLEIFEYVGKFFSTRQPSVKLEHLFGHLTSPDFGSGHDSQSGHHNRRWNLEKSPSDTVLFADCSRGRCEYHVLADQQHVQFGLRLVRRVDHGHWGMLGWRVFRRASWHANDAVSDAAGGG